MDFMIPESWKMEDDPDGNSQQVAVIMTGEVYRNAGLKNSKHPKVEGLLYDKLCQIGKHKLRDDVRRMAVNIATAVGDKEFKPTVAWLDNFMRRFCLSRKKMGFHSSAMLKTKGLAKPPMIPSSTDSTLTQEAVFSVLGISSPATDGEPKETTTENGTSEAGTSEESSVNGVNGESENKTNISESEKDDVDCSMELASFDNSFAADDQNSAEDLLPEKDPLAVCVDSDAQANDKTEKDVKDKDKTEKDAQDKDKTEKDAQDKDKIEKDAQDKDKTDKDAQDKDKTDKDAQDKDKADKDLESKGNEKDNSEKGDNDTVSQECTDKMGIDSEICNVKTEKVDSPVEVRHKIRVVNIDSLRDPVQKEEKRVEEAEVIMLDDDESDGGNKKDDKDSSNNEASEEEASSNSAETEQSDEEVEEQSTTENEESHDEDDEDEEQEAGEDEQQSPKDEIVEQYNEEERKKSKQEEDELILEYSKAEKKYFKKNLERLQKRINDSVMRCTSCNELVNHQIRSLVFTHPVLGIFICKRCRKYYGKGRFCKDDEGYDEYCRLCAEGGDLLCCEQENCFNGFCKRCIKRTMGRSELKNAENTDNWACYVCDPTPMMEMRALHRTILENLKKLDEQNAAMSRKERSRKSMKSKFEVLKRNREEKSKLKTPEKQKTNEKKKTGVSPKEKPVANKQAVWLKEYLDSMSEMLNACLNNVEKIKGKWEEGGYSKDCTEKAANRTIKQLLAIRTNFEIIESSIGEEMKKTEEHQDDDTKVSKEETKGKREKEEAKGKKDESTPVGKSKDQSVKPKSSDKGKGGQSKKKAKDMEEEEEEESMEVDEGSQEASKADLKSKKNESLSDDDMFDDGYGAVSDKNTDDEPDPEGSREKEKGQKKEKAKGNEVDKEKSGAPKTRKESDESDGVSDIAESYSGKKGVNANLDDSILSSTTVEFVDAGDSSPSKGCDKKKITAENSELDNKLDATVLYDTDAELHEDDNSQNKKTRSEKKTENDKQEDEDGEAKKGNKKNVSSDNEEDLISSRKRKKISDIPDNGSGKKVKRAESQSDDDESKDKKADMESSADEDEGKENDKIGESDVEENLEKDQENDETEAKKVKKNVKNTAIKEDSEDENDKEKSSEKKSLRGKKIVKEDEKDEDKDEENEAKGKKKRGRRKSVKEDKDEEEEEEKEEEEEEEEEEEDKGTKKSDSEEEKEEEDKGSKKRGRKKSEKDDDDNDEEGDDEKEDKGGKKRGRKKKEDESKTKKGAKDEDGDDKGKKKKSLSGKDRRKSNDSEKKTKRKRRTRDDDDDDDDNEEKEKKKKSVKRKAKRRRRDGSDEDELLGLGFVEDSSSRSESESSEENTDEEIRRRQEDHEEEKKAKKKYNKKKQEKKAKSLKMSSDDESENETSKEKPSKSKKTSEAKDVENEEDTDEDKPSKEKKAKNKLSKSKGKEKQTKPSSEDDENREALMNLLASDSDENAESKEVEDAPAKKKKKKRKSDSKSGDESDDDKSDSSSEEEKELKDEKKTLKLKGGKKKSKFGSSPFKNDNQKAKDKLLESESEDELEDKPKPKCKKKNYRRDSTGLGKEMSWRRKLKQKRMQLSEEEAKALEEKQLAAKAVVKALSLSDEVRKQLEDEDYVDVTDFPELYPCTEDGRRLDSFTYDSDADSEDSDKEFEKLMKFKVSKTFTKPAPKSKKKYIEAQSDEDEQGEDEADADGKSDDDEEEKVKKEGVKKRKKKEGLLDISIDKEEDDDDEEDEPEEKDKSKKKKDGGISLNEKIKKQILLSSDEEEEEEEEEEELGDLDDGQADEKRRKKYDEKKKKKKEEEEKAREEEDEEEEENEDDEAEESKPKVKKQGYMKLDISSDDDDDDGGKDAANSDEEEEDSDDDDSDFEESPRKKRAFQLSSSSESDFDTKKKKKKNATSTSDSDDEDEEEESKPKRKRIKKVASSSDEGGDEDGGDEESKSKDGSPNKHKKIRRVIRDEDLMESTKNATQEEDERRKRIADRQKRYNQIFEVDVESDQKELGKLVLDFDPDSKEELVSVHEKIVKSLKPHQFKGIKFMWDATVESLEMLKKKSGGGCILAHCMGLGKTLQVIAFIHTLLTSKKVNRHIQRVMVCCPVNTVHNWVQEFNNWLKGKMMPFDVIELVSAKDLWGRAYRLDDWYREGGVCIIGYDMFRNLSNSKSKRYKGKMKEIFQKALVDPGPEVIVCDEGHILKNEKTALSIAINHIKTMRRIILTGTPLQNNLKEYHCMIQFVKPNLLGTKKEFMNRFVNPIEQGQCSDAMPRDVRRMKRRAHILHNLLEGCVQRFDYTVLKPFLPPKFEYVVSVQLSELQIKLYQYYLDNLAQGGPKRQGSGLFVDFGALSRVWTHPKVLELAVRRAVFNDDEEEMDDFICDDTTTSESSEDERPAKKKKLSSKGKKDGDDSVEEEEVVAKDEVEPPGPIPGLTASGKVRVDWWKKVLLDNVGDNYEEDGFMDKLNHSGKLILLLDILRECGSIGDKVLVFSQSLLALDMIEEFLELVDRGMVELPMPEDPLPTPFKQWRRDRDYVRLDGSTSADTRKNLCKSFNNPSNERCRLFLISTRAGGLGINLVAANRVIIFDSSWNPSHDTQSIFRIYRFGQKKPCYVYRFVAQGTMEEKIYSRQVTKMSTALRVVDEHQIKRYFNMAELAQLYEFNPAEVNSRSTPAVPEDRLLAELLKRQKDWIVNYHEHDSLLENQTSEELSEEERKAAWEDYENEKKGFMVQDQRNSVMPVVNSSTMMAPMGGPSMSLSQFSFEGVVNTIKAQNPNLSPNELYESVVLATKQIQKIHLNHYQRVQGMVYNLKNPMIAPEQKKLMPFGNHPEMLPMLQQQLRILEDNIQRENNVINHISQLTPKSSQAASKMMSAGLVRGQPTSKGTIASTANYVGRPPQSNTISMTPVPIAPKPQQNPAEEIMLD